MIMSKMAQRTAGGNQMSIIHPMTLQNNITNFGHPGGGGDLALLASELLQNSRISFQLGLSNYNEGIFCQSFPVLKYLIQSDPKKSDLTYKKGEFSKCE